MCASVSLCNVQVCVHASTGCVGTIGVFECVCVCVRVHACVYVCIGVHRYMQGRAVRGGGEAVPPLCHHKIKTNDD